jgi:hypothetical protein
VSGGREVISGNLQRRMQALRSLQRLLDEAFRVPGTGVRFGWDPIIGVVPWLGDALTAVLSCAIVLQARHMRVPRVVQLRMLGNIGIDLLVGAIPFLGDVVDLFWKSNARNFALLERHAAAPPVGATAGDWLFAAGLLAAVIAMALVPLFVLYWIVNVLTAHFPALAR